ncbi:MAG: T9SS type A sorting domain-containing protein [Chitinophagales bacterium]
MNHFHCVNSLSLILWIAAIVFTSLPLNATNPIEVMQETAKSIDLELAYTADATSYSVFTNALFTLTLTNKGIDNATGITVYAPFSNGLAFTSATVSQGEYSEWSSIWNVSNLASGQSVTLELSLFVLDVSGDIRLFAQVQSANETDIDSTPNNNTTQTPAEDDETSLTATRLGGNGGNGNQEVDIELTMTTNHTEVNVGLQFSYILTAINNGLANATGVKIKLPLPSEVTYVSSTNDQTTYNPTTGEWNIGNIASKVTRTLLVNVEVKVGGTISATAEVVATNEKDVDSTPNNGLLDEDDTFSVEVLGLQIDLELNMALPLGASNVVEQGSEVTFIVYVENKGPTVGYNSKIRAIFPIGFTYLRNTVTMGEYLEDVEVWYIGDIPPFETQVMEITASVDSPGPLTYTCEVRTSNVPDVDSTPSNFDPNEDDIDSITIYTDVDTAIDELLNKDENLKTFVAYPIPSHDFVRLLFDSKAESRHLRLYDFSGRMVYQQMLETIAGENNVELDLTPFSTGVYFVLMETEKGNVRAKVVKR